MKHIVCFFLMINLFSCSRDPILLEMDNGSEKDIVVELEDMKPFTLKKYTSYGLEMQPGKKKVKFDYGEEITFTLDYRYKTLLNPGRTTYYMETIRYATQKSAGMAFGNINDSLEIGGYKVVGPYRSLGNDLILKGNWTFGLNKIAPQNIEVKTDSYSLGYGQANKGQLRTERRLLNDIELQYKVSINRLLKAEAQENEIIKLLGLTQDQYDKLRGRAK